VNFPTPLSKVHAKQVDTYPERLINKPVQKLVRKLLNQGVPQASGKNSPLPETCLTPSSITNRQHDHDTRIDRSLQLNSLQRQS